MNKPKIIFFDIDGTLVPLKEGIRPRTVEALQKLRQNGVKLCIATGRAPMEVPKFEGVTFDAFLTYNGSYCFTPEQDIFKNTIPPEEIALLIRNAAALGRPISLATKTRLAANGSEKDLVDYYAIAGVTLTVADDFDEVAKGEVFQALMGGREEEYPAILKDVTHAKIAAWWDRAMDIIPANGGKGIAVEKVLEFYGIDKADAMAFGDGNNDIEMFGAVGTGVAMANGSERLKAAAKDHCRDVKEDGIYWYCVEHGLI